MPRFAALSFGTPTSFLRSSPSLKNSLLLRRRGPRRGRTRGELLRRAHLPTRRCETIYATPATLLPEHVRTRTGLALTTRRVGRLLPPSLPLLLRTAGCVIQTRTRSTCPGDTRAGIFELFEGLNSNIRTRNRQAGREIAYRPHRR